VKRQNDFRSPAVPGTSSGRTHRLARIKRPAADQPPALKVPGVHMLAEQVIPLAPPRDASLVHRQRLVAASEAVGVIEQAPRHEPAGDDGDSVRGCFRLAAPRVLGTPGVPQLPDATAPRVPEEKSPAELASVWIRQEK